MTVTYAVHGFGYEPGSPLNSPDGFFSEIEEMAGRPVTGFEWSSLPTGLRLGRPVSSSLVTLWNSARAMLAGYFTTYQWAYHEKAREAAVRFSKRLLETAGEPPDVVAHSLGAKVAIEGAAIAAAVLPEGFPPPVRRMLVLNGALLVSESRKHLDTRFAGRVMNVVVSSDRVLGILAEKATNGDREPTIGAYGLIKNRPSWWRDLHIDAPSVREAAKTGRGWSLSGDNPDSLLDHFYSYRSPDNWPVTRAFLNGDDLVDLAV